MHSEPLQCQEHNIVDRKKECFFRKTVRKCILLIFPFRRLLHGVVAAADKSNTTTFEPAFITGVRIDMKQTANGTGIFEHPSKR